MLLNSLSLIALFFILSASGFVQSMSPKVTLASISRFSTLQTTRRAVKSAPKETKISNARSSTKVVTDIDDTVKSSGGVKLFGIPLGGIDSRFRRGVFYPGAFQFAFELSAKSKKVIPENVAVLTARAKEFKFALALKPTDKLCSAYRAIGERNGFGAWGIGDVYYGSVAEWIFQDRKGIRKFDNFSIMLQNDISNNRNCDYILVGDTGEKDEEAGERIAQKYGRSRVRAIFLHAVSDKKDEKDHQLPQDRLTNGVPIYYFRTYVGAAAKACKNQLISNDGLKRVIDAARADLTKIQISNEDFSRNLERDIAEAKGKKFSITAFVAPPKSGLFAAFQRSSISGSRFWKP